MILGNAKDGKKKKPFPLLLNFVDSKIVFHNLYFRILKNAFLGSDYPEYVCVNIFLTSAMKTLKMQQRSKVLDENTLYRKFKYFSE